MRVGVLVNPTAGRGRAAREHKQVAWRLRLAGHLIVDLTGPDADSARANALRHRDRLDALVVVGGDGVTQLGLSIVAGSDIPLGIVPLGTGNDISRGLGIPAKPADAIDFLLHAMTVHTRRRPGGVLTDAILVDRVDEPAKWVAATVSCGLDALVNERANQLAWPKGELRYPRALLQVLSTFTPATYTIKTDSWDWTGRAMLVAVSNIGLFGGGMRIAPDASPTDGLADVVIVHEIGKLELIRVFPQIYSGKHTSHPAVEIRRATSVSVHADRDLPAFGDGEPLGRLPAEMKVVPHAARVFRGPLP